MIAIVDSGGANLASVMFAIERLGKSYKFTHDPDVILRSSHVIFPGVGTAAHAMNVLNKNGLIGCLKALTQPVLGICLGMQLLFSWSAEGGVETLNILPGKVQKFPDGLQPIPHMGWNTLSISKSNLLFNGIPDKSYMYFIHSYSAPITEFTIATTEYCNKFSSVVSRDNFFGCQFHPERSGTLGSQLLKNFLEF